MKSSHSNYNFQAEYIHKMTVVYLSLKRATLMHAIDRHKNITDSEAHARICDRL